jgi:NADH-quinone oxidoreductase subunit L
MLDIQKLYLLVPLAPLGGAMIAGLLGWAIGRRAAHVVTILGMLVCLAASWLVYQDVMQGNTFNGPV